MPATASSISSSAPRVPHCREHGGGLLQDRGASLLLCNSCGWSSFQVGAFLLARYLVRDLVVHYVSKKWPKWDLIDHMLVRPLFGCLPLSLNRWQRMVFC